MKSVLLKITLLITILAIQTGLSAQARDITITGKVVESSSKQAVMFATVVVGDLNSKQIIDGTTTLEDGSFSIVSTTDSFYIQISFLGFTTKIIDDITIVNGKVNLGVVELSQSATNIEAVEVEAERSQTVFKLDKRVFNVGQDLSSTGASAVEVLNNVPSVNVDIEGAISLRGSSGVQILINGKPSILANSDGNALGTITADMIDRVEVITNPSAKYDAEGSSGIINIVLKKEEKKGLNGSISLNTGIPDNHSIGVSLNRRTEKWNLFSQLGAGYRSLPRDNENINRDLVNNTEVVSEGTDYRNETFYNMTLGADYHINKLNVITLSGNFAYEIEDQPSTTNFSRYSNDSLMSQWYRDEITEATNPKWQYELQYQKDFEDDEAHKFLFSALGSFFGKELSSEFDNVTTFGEQADPLQRTETDFSESNYTFKADYSKPINDYFSYETGGQYVITDVGNDYAVSNFVSNGWTPDASLTNLFEYDQKVLGLYGTLAYEKDKWGVKGGLRMENTDLATLLTNTNEKNGQNYTNFFPSLHTSYKLSEAFSLQAGYSKRIYRPRLWDLNPFFNIRNNYSIRTGNPNPYRKPQFTT